MNEDRILDKLDRVEQKITEVSVSLARVEEQIKEVPDLKTRVGALEKWKWGTMGALAVSGSSLGVTLIKAIGG